jgi:hypothetical protein
MLDQLSPVVVSLKEERVKKTKEKRNKKKIDFEK